MRSPRWLRCAPSARRPLDQRDAGEEVAALDHDRHRAVDHVHPAELEHRPVVERGAFELPEPDGRHLREAALRAGEHRGVFTRFTTTTWSAPAADFGRGSGTRASSRRASPRPSAPIGQPQKSSVMPNDARRSVCPCAVPPPWLPIAGTMNGAAPRPHVVDRRLHCDGDVRDARLPRSPRRDRLPTRDPRSSDCSASSTRPATSSIFGPRTDWRARKNEGRSRAIAGWYRRSLAAVLEDTDRAHFEERGYLRVPGAFTPTEAEAMRDVVWRALERQGFRRDDPTTWVNESPSNLQSLKGDDVFKALRAQELEGISAMSSARAADGSSRPTGRVLLAVPDAPSVERPVEGVAPRPRLCRPASPVDGLKVHSMFGDVAPGRRDDDRRRLTSRGGTPLRRPSAPAGSKGRPAAQAAHAQQRLSRELGTDGEPGPRIARFFERDEDVCGIPLRAVELTASGRRDPHPPAVAAHAPYERGHAAEVPAEQGPLSQSPAASQTAG